MRTYTAVLLLLMLTTLASAQVPPSVRHEIDSLLLAASSTGDEAEVARLLDAGADPDAHHPHHWTPLMHAAYNGHVSIAERLLDRGARINMIRDEYGTALCIAAMSPIVPPDGPTSMVRLLLARGASLEKGDGVNTTPLFIAVWKRKADVVDLLIAAGANVDSYTMNVMTALDVAMEAQDTTSLRQLLAAGADPNTHTITSPLDQAIETGNLPAIAMLLRAGADPDRPSEVGELTTTPLIRAVRTRNTRVVKALLDAGVNPNFTLVRVNGGRVVSALDIALGSKDRVMITLLENAGGRRDLNALYVQMRTAVVRNDLPALEKILALGLNPRVAVLANGKDFWFLHEAAARGYDRLVSALLDVPVEHPSYLVYAAYNAARDSSRESTMELLVRRMPGVLANEAALAGDLDLLERTLAVSDTIINMRDEDGESLLHDAVNGNHAEVAAWLLARGARIVQTHRWKQTPLFFAVRRGNEEMVEMLLTAGDSLTHRDQQKTTPLLAAVQYKWSSIVSLLAAKGADIEAQDEDEWRALHHAAWEGDLTTARILLELGADRNARTYDKLTAIELARARELNEMVELLGGK